LIVGEESYLHAPIYEDEKGQEDGSAAQQT
jgi:hypothetical protein